MQPKQTTNLDAALSDALQLRKTYAILTLPNWQHVRDQEGRFRAQLERRGTTFVLEVTTGVEETVETFFGGLESKCFGRAAGTVNDALVWLMLHELSHLDLGHFELAECFGIAQRASVHPRQFEPLPHELRQLAPLCLELQADHEATDLVLGQFLTDDRDGLRQRVLAISGMMMLIELEDTKVGAEGRTHPKSATRIFQLLGHLAEMPLVQAQVSQDVSLIPNEKELKAFAHEVTIPCFFDAIQLAQAAGATSIASDLGSPENFFKDLEIAKLGEPSRYTEFKTQGAQEWATLWPCNEALKPILGGHFTT